MKKLLSISKITTMALLYFLTSCIKPDDTIFFLRMPRIPTVITNDPENITSHTAYLSGSVSATGSGPITACGINIYVSGCSRIQCSPQEVFVENRYSENNTESSFWIFLRDLSPNTIYHYRAFATNSAGTASGEMKILTTLKSPEN